MADIDTPTPSSHDSHDNPYEAAAAQARAFGFEQIARGFDELVGNYTAPAGDDQADGDSETTGAHTQV